MEIRRLVFIVFTGLFVAPLCYAGEWTRVSPWAIRFEGEIGKDEFARFQKIYKPTDNTLIVNSQGGRMDSALAIGQVLIRNPKLTVVVQTACASSCANYLFLAGHTRVIDHGIVGFHGNWKAMVESEKFKTEGAKLDPAVRAKLLPWHLSKAAEETEFMRKTGASQELFDRTQLENDGGLYDLYLPGPLAFQKYGIKNVVGTQDMDIVRANPDLKFLYDNSSETGPPGPAPASPGIAR